MLKVRPRKIYKFSINCVHFNSPWDQICIGPALWAAKGPDEHLVPRALCRCGSCTMIVMRYCSGCHYIFCHGCSCPCDPSCARFILPILPTRSYARCSKFGCQCSRTRLLWCMAFVEHRDLSRTPRFYNAGLGFRECGPGLFIILY